MQARCIVENLHQPACAAVPVAQVPDLEAPLSDTSGLHRRSVCCDVHAGSAEEDDQRAHHVVLLHIRDAQMLASCTPHIGLQGAVSKVRRRCSTSLGMRHSGESC